MRTAVDTSVLIDVLEGDPTFGESSRLGLARAYDAGALVACDIVWAEVRAHFDDDDAFRAAATALHLRFDPIQAATAAVAGALWRKSRRSAKGTTASRQRLVADFLVGTHALQQADALLTRDHGFYRRAFAGLAVIDPASARR